MATQSIPPVGAPGRPVPPGTQPVRPPRPHPPGSAAAPGQAGRSAGSPLDESGLFGWLSEGDLSALKSRMVRLTVARGAVLFEEGDASERLFLLDGGKIKLTHAAADGRENLLSVLGPGQMFGELSVFDPGPRSSRASAVVDSVVLALSDADLFPLLADRPDLARGLLRQLAHRLRRSNDTVADLIFSDVPGRVAKALLDLADRFGRPGRSGLRVTHDLTQEELAQLVGASRETVNKALADFAHRGWLNLEQRSVVLLDVDRLRRRAG